MPIRFGPWLLLPDAGELRAEDGRVERLEPKVAELLGLFLSRPRAVWTRDEIMQRVWPGVIVGEDTLARTVSRLRRALDDDARTPRYLETLHKRGYRWIGESAAEPDAAVIAEFRPMSPAATRTSRRWFWIIAVALLLLALPVLLFFQSDPRPAVSTEGSSDDRDVARAEDFYFRYSRDRNEAAIALYERILARNPDHAGALAGLANALVQRAMRWPDPPGPQSREFTQLGDALQAGHLQSRAALAELERAEWLARAAVRLQPDSPAAHKALGLVLSASNELDAALQSYQRAVELDPDAWGAMINLADVNQIRNQPDEALSWFESAHAAMTRVYDSQSAHVQPWYSELAVVIGDHHLARDALGPAERWYRTALEHRPLHPEAMRGLARALSRAGQHDAAREVCERLRARIDAAENCPPDS